MLCKWSHVIFSGKHSRNDTSKTLENLIFLASIAARFLVTFFFQKIEPCGDAATGPSYSDGVEDYGSPDQPGDQARQVPADLLHRQGCCRYVCGDAKKGPSSSDVVEDCGSPDNQVTKHAEFPQSWCIDKVVVDMLVVMQ